MTRSLIFLNLRSKSVFVTKSDCASLALKTLAPKVNSVASLLSTSEPNLLYSVFFYYIIFLYVT